mmetsp:Transcript_2271/g.3007  ORF Transcript_2271/g.3007 Transcript_2271/m.3007 type:complete len:986 (+) Transcript_2271:82-3039(+)|eukprot:CAMPEP_0168563632 /NCGR_PEP_ID=MMETSP0413-20121227/12782_1 /TAXON_ID=136452 /ORGANISM="Filamoeba nolandi, Strain NC-AS-23-1" /LENGTH=985 /DNA_ID=CAMNT_0008595183 /DNA_START=70 /DNA_END=3027 /DNA_ORIENTATION=+
MSDKITSLTSLPGLTSQKSSMRGLHVFISDIRNCQSKEEEEKRVNKELAKIRKKFKEAEIDGYDRKKYVAKIVYMFMLGYDIDFGYIEAVTLLSAQKYQEKSIGYLALGILLHENHEMLPLIIQSLQNDLQSRNEWHQCLALSAIGNIGGKEMAEALAPIVIKLLTSKVTKATIKKKAALCLLRLYRKYPECITSENWVERLQTILDEYDLGLLTSVMSLVIAIAVDNPKQYEPLVKKAIWILTKIVINRDYTKDYMYYHMPAPWLQVKLLRFLSFYDPPEDSASKSKLYEILAKILQLPDSSKGNTINDKNILNAVLFEAIGLIVHYDDDRELIKQASTLLGRFVSNKESSNTRYLALNALGKLASLDTETANLVKRHQETVIQALRDPDISIRKRALDLLYTMCDRSNAKLIVNELLSYLASAEYAIREELVLKIAILAEKFANDYSWYVDVILRMIALAGDFVSDDIWFRVVQIVTNHEDIQEYAAKTVFEALKQHNCHETAVKVGGYILGEFGHLIADHPSSSPREQFEALHSKFGNCGLTGKALLLSSYMKFINLYPELTETIRPVFKAHSSSMDVEVQQRACEYGRLMNTSEELLQRVWEVMPVFPERASNRLGTQEGGEKESTPSQRPTNATPTSRPAPVKEESLLDIPSAAPSSVTTQKAPPQQQRFDPLSELEGILGGSIRTTPAVTPQPVMQTNTAVSGFATGGASTPVLAPTSGITGTAPQTNNNTIPAQNTGGKEKLSDAFKRICVSNEGVLYQDEYIQVGFKSEYSKGLGRMMLYFGNVSATQSLTNFNSIVSNHVNHISLNIQPVTSTVEPRTQAQQLITMACLSADFSTFPQLTISFSAAGKNVNIPVKLPLVVSKFMEPAQMNAPEFFQLWKQYDGPQTIIKSPRAVDLMWLSKFLATGFRLAVLSGVDPNTNNVVASGVFLASNNPNPEKCLVRIETNPAAAMYRVSVKSPSTELANAVKDLLEVQLG